MDRTAFAYAMKGIEDYPSQTAEGREYATPHCENFVGEILEDSKAEVADELSDLTSFEKVVQAKRWREQARRVLTDCQDAVMIAELSADKESRARACSDILLNICEIVDFNMNYALDVLYRRYNIYTDATPDFVRIRHGISEEDNADMMNEIDSFLSELFTQSRKLADRVLKEV